MATNMQRYLLTGLGLLMMIIAGCKDTTGTVGLDLPDDEQLNVTLVDTLSINSSTVLLDTVNTQDAGRILSGAYTDPYLGRVHASGFCTFMLPTSFGLSDQARYKQLELFVKPNYYYGQSGQQQHLSIHRVTEQITPDEEGDPLYNTDTFVYEANPLGESTFIPEETDSLSIALSDALGKQLFDAILRGDELTLEENEFQKFLKGLALLGNDKANTALTGFDADSTGDIALRLHYSDYESGVLEEEYVSFPAEWASSFSHIDSERPAPLSQLKDPNDALPSTATQNRTYMQNGVGLVSRLEFPTLERLFNVVEENYTLVKAELYLFPIPHSYEEATPLPSSLQLVVADEHNRTVGYLTDDSGNIQTASPTVDEEFNANTFYEFDVTTFIQNELDTQVNTGYGLLVTTAEDTFRSTADRLVLGSHEHPEYKMYVQLTLSEFEF